MNPLAKTETQCRKRLADQQISNQEPGTILSDVQALIDFIGVKGIATKSRQGNLPAAVLPELNKRLSQPIELVLNRPLLRDYPNIAGPYILLRVMNLVRVDGSRVWADDAALQVWKDLNPTEKYFALLEAWLLDADGNVLGGESRKGSDGFSNTLYFLTRSVSAGWKTFDEYCHIYGFRGGVSAWNTQLMVRFGLIEAKPRPVSGRRSAARGWLMEKAKRTPWGKAVAWAIFERLVETVESEFNLELLCLPEELPAGFLRPAFKPFFPELRKAYSPPKTGIRSGVYVFKAALDTRYHGCAEVWRQLAVPGEFTLYALADSVLDAFDFDDKEHLHELRFKGQSGKQWVFFHPYSDERPFSDEIAVDEAGLSVKQVIRYKFDCGDDWRFLIQLERIDPPDEGLEEIKVIETAGKAPKQHPDEEQDWEW